MDKLQREPAKQIIGKKFLLQHVVFRSARE